MNLLTRDLGKTPDVNPQAAEEKGLFRTGGGALTH
jgi:hypothetical protein